MSEYKPNIKKNSEGKYEIFDPVRKIFVALTEEESVRQFMIHLLHAKLGVSYALMGIEKQIKVFSMIKRPDIIVFDNQGNVDILVECKAPNISLNQEVLDQIIRYNMKLKANYLILSNGKNIHCLKCTDNKIEKIEFEGIYRN